MEVFKDIFGFEGLYQVSNMGAVKSLKCNKKIILKQGRIGDNGRYRNVVLVKDNVRYSRYVHHLVAENFIGLRPDGFVIDHVNNISSDNKVENLRYITQRENLTKNHPNGNKIKGVTYNKRAKAYYAQISIKMKKIKLASHKTDIDYLSRVYQKACELISLYKGDNKEFILLVSSRLNS